MVIMVKVCKRLHIVTLHSVRFIYSWVCLHVFMPLSIKLGQHHLLKKTWKTPEALSSKPSIHGTLTFTEQDIMRDLEIKASFLFPLPLSSKTFPLEHGGLEQAWPNTIPCSAPDVSAVPTSKSHRKLYCSAFTFWKLLIHLEIANILTAKMKSIWHQLIARLEWLQNCYLWRNQELQRVHYALQPMQTLHHVLYEEAELRAFPAGAVRGYLVERSC